MALTFELAGDQIDGARDYQEDAFLITHFTDKDGQPSALIIIADGMGGHAAGNVASNMAVQAFNKHVSSHYPCENLAEVLKDAVLKANFAIKETVSETEALKGMGCTMVGAILEGNAIWWASVGDSHLYVIRGTTLTKVNADHSYGGFIDRMKAAGNPVEPKKGYSRNMLMSALTGDDIEEIDVPDQPYEMQKDDLVILCSDGLDTMSHGKIIQYSSWSENPKDCVDALLRAVEEAQVPKQDNTTVAVVKVIEKQEASGLEFSDELGRDSGAIGSDQAQKTSSQAGSEAEREGGGGNKGLLAIAMVLLLIVGGGFAYFLLDPSVSKAPSSEGDSVEPSSQEAVAIEEEKPLDSEPPEVVASKPPPASATAVPKKTSLAPPEAKVSRAFQDPLKSGGMGPEMIVVPEGEFMMGSPDNVPKSEERPQHSVKVASFAISRYEITIGEFEKYTSAMGLPAPQNYRNSKDDFPVFKVNWDEAYNYVRWLSDQTGKRYSLPNEAQWEYAAKGGKESTFWWGGLSKPGMAHCFDCETGLDPRNPTKIGSFKPNGYGLYDTAGNLGEWVHDCWHKNYETAPAYADVWDGGDCNYRVVRGGSYAHVLDSLRSAKRGKIKANQKSSEIGIRIVRRFP
ncbi:MAG: SUMF1/EgtB/PvdO family nonheme iron enzyme [Candidatus Eutrophobiaceae bacterium]